MRAQVRVAAVLLVIVGLACRDDRLLREARRQVKAALETGEKPFRGKKRSDAGDVWKDVRAFYERRQFTPAWIEGRRPRAKWDHFREALQAAQRHGLEPLTYDVNAQLALRAQTNRTILGAEEVEESRIGETDVRITYTFLLFASHLLHGELDPEDVDAAWTAKRRRADLPAIVAKAIETGDVQGALDSVAPRHDGYQWLAAALARLRAEGHAQEARRVELNLDRWRWLPESLGGRYVLVNIPSYELRLVDGGKEALRMKVVVGKAFNPTPVFSDEITYLVFNPRWNIPPNILVEEIVPEVQKDRGYLERHDMEIVKDGQIVSVGDVDLDEPKSFEIRQRSGPKNALGLVKFGLPNKFDVYLHDTPADALFSRTSRAFSHGCVRLEKPVELAQALLRDQPKWTRVAIEKAMQDGTEQHVELRSPIPVHIVYLTAWAEQDGTLRFGEDVYGHDQTQSAALTRARSGPEPRRASAR